MSVKRTFESIQQIIFHSVTLSFPFVVGTSIPSGALSSISGVLELPRSRNCASVSNGTPKVNGYTHTRAQDHPYSNIRINCNEMTNIVVGYYSEPTNCL
jgi:hypothetical protein